MSTATEISRLTDARNTIRDKLIDLGLAASTDKLDVLAEAVDGITNRGAISATVQEGDTYTIPAGYHNGSGTVSGVAGGGNYSLQSKTVTPTKAQQSITPDSGYYGLSDVTVAMIPEAYQNVSGVTATAADVLSSKVIVDATGASITGTMANNGAVAKTLDASTGNQSYTVPAGYHNGSGAVSIVLESKTATPTTASQTITPTTGKVLSSVTVNAIPGNFADVTDDTATAASMLAGTTAHVLDEGVATQITGTIPTKGAADITYTSESGDMVLSVPQGYYPATSKTIAGASHDSPTISFNTTNGTITATHEQLAGWIGADDTKTATQALNTKSAATYYVSMDNDQVIAAGQYLTGAQTIKKVIFTSLDAINIAAGVTVKIGDSGDPARLLELEGLYTADATAAAGDILAAKTAYVNGAKLTGTMADNGTVTKTLDATTDNQSFTIAAGKHSGSGAVNIVLEEKSATPAASAQTVTPTTGKVLSKVTVNAIPAVWGNTTNDTAVAANLLAGATAHTLNAAGTAAIQITGTMPDNGAIAGSIDGLTTTTYTVPAGYTTGGTVTLTNDIELALAAI